jgi:hypothetical protein
MYSKLSNYFILLTVVMLFCAMQSFAQTPDTVDVVVTPGVVGALNDFINADTLADGTRKNPERVYRLQRNQIYFCDAPLVAIGWHFHLVAAKPTGPGDNSAPPVLMQGKNDLGDRNGLYVYATGDITIRGIWFYCYLTDPGVKQIVDDDGLIFAAGDSARVTLTENIFDGAHVAIASKAYWQDFFIENNHARNLLGTYSWYIGHFLHVDKGLAEDTIIIRNNTMFNCGGFTLANNLENYLLFEHNTVVGNHVHPFVSSGDWNGATNRDIKNNIIYATFNKGCKEVRDPVTDSITYSENWTTSDGYYWAVTDVDTLDPFILDTLMHMVDTDRHISWENNAYFWPKPLTDLYTKHADSLIAPKWANEHTTKFFSDPNYPKFNMSGNIEADPGFNADVMATMQDAADYIEGFQMNWEGSPQTSDFVHYYPTAAAHSLDTYAFYPPFSYWPLTEDLKYSNVAMQTAGTDGKPLGDLNWWPGLVGVERDDDLVPSKFELSQNYPNPFNPSTTISFSIPEASQVSLAIYNMLGQKVADIVNEQLTSGKYQVKYDASNLASGLYFYTIKAGDSFSLTKKMMLLK